MFRLLLLLLLVLPFTGRGQFTVSGRVINHTDKKPVAAATVFLNNTAGGTITAYGGAFALTNVKTGQYNLVVSCVGYETFYQKVTVNDALVSLPVIELMVKTTELKEVKVKAPDPNRARYLEMFLKDFLGSTANAAQCKLLNPDELDLDYDRNKNTLSASSYNYLIFENKALGYKLYYQLSKYEKNFGSRMLYYEGPVRFEEMPGKTSHQKKWVKNRLITYQGSAMHFLRSVYNGNYQQESFKVLKLTRKPNPARPPDSVLRAGLRKYVNVSTIHPEWRDSASYYSAKFNLSSTVEYLYSTPLTEHDFVITAADGMKSLRYKDYLYVIYLKKFINKGNAFGIDYPSTVLTLNMSQALFDHNGVFVDPNSIIVEGAWSINGVADLLPVDYVPLQVKKI